MIAVDQLSKQYGTLLAVDDVSFTVVKGTIAGLIGPNGAGKSTLLRMLVCALTPTSGSAALAGYSITKSSKKVRQNIGDLPETPPLYPDMTVGSYLSFAAGIHNVPRKDLKEKVEEALKLVQMENRYNQLIRRLSHGYKKRLGIAQAIVHKPPVVILDEPTSGLDPLQVEEFAQLIGKLSGQHTILLASHDLSLIHRLCEHVLVLSHGKLVKNLHKDELEDEENKDWASLITKVFSTKE